MKWIVFIILFSSVTQAKEIALSFDDAPMPNSKHFESLERSSFLIEKLKSQSVPPIMIFANPCKGENSLATFSQLKKYVDAGHVIGNHTCSHPKLDDVGFDIYYKDAAEGDRLLVALFSGQKIFRFPYLNESNDRERRDQMRQWLKENHYRNGMVSVDNDDYIFSFKINEARDKGINTIDYKKVEKLFIEHVVGGVNFYDEFAKKTIGYSPKHVLLLHEMDATVMFMESLVKALRQDGWKIISIEEAYQDKLYLEQPKNLYANNGIIAQVHYEKTGQKIGYHHFDTIKDELDTLLGI